MLGNAAMLAGLLGTVNGLIQCFEAVAHVNPADKATILSQGISEAMNCTFFGLLVAIPNGNVIYCVLGLAIFGGFTIFDFNRLRRAQMASSVPIAASIFLDIFNIFLFFLELFGGEGRS